MNTLLTPFNILLATEIIGFLLVIVCCFKLSQKYRYNQHTLELIFMKELKENQITITEKLHQGQIENLQHLQTSLYANVQEMRVQLNENLQQMSHRVNQQLHDGLEKSTATFTDVVKRLTIIDEAQKKINELSTNVVNLQAILSNKSARGAFGEIQLSGLIQNMIPASHYAFQHTLSNGKRADCILFLPEPSGHIIIDAKFPLENYQRVINTSNEIEKNKFSQQFRQDIKKHIKDIMEKYIIPNETSSGAVMFIPAESVFSEIHANYPDLIQFSHECNVWLVSPTTLMAVLTTARAVLKDDATRKQVHIIQEHLKRLSEDFKRFDKRMHNLTRHIQQAHDEAADVHVSAKKITHRFEKIERLDMQKEINTEVSEPTSLIASEHSQQASS